MEVKANMTLNEYHTAAVNAKKLYPADKALPVIVLGLTEEAGEVAGKVKKFLRGDSIDPCALDLDVAMELGDVLWYLCNVADYFGYTLEQVAAMNIVKLNDREERNALSGSGDNR